MIDSARLDGSRDFAIYVTAWEESHGLGQAVIPSRDWFGSKMGMARLELRLLSSRDMAF